MKYQASTLLPYMDTFYFADILLQLQAYQKVKIYLASLSFLLKMSLLNHTIRL